MAKTWYPVINYLTCAECGTCVAKCPHGVYDTSKAPSPVVKNPQACIDHCHGCGNRCPVGAINYVGDDTGWTPPNSRKADKALSYFSNNFNCSQSVFTTFAIEMGIAEDIALKLATEFGGGARCGQMCGAVSGALMVLGLNYGHYHSDNQDEKAKAYSLAVDFNERFCKKNKSIVCKDLLGYDLSVSKELAVIKEKNLFQTVCPKMITDAVEILEQMLFEEDAKCSCDGTCC
ncbi:MAG: C-GCAxxG-C-C family (seleno)protein [Bacillota bacterium]|nr:C-GCAxxG-C-C family (seleno)protein [Bacillota bacterium]